MSNTDGIGAEDVKSVAKSINIKLSAQHINQILKEYPSEQRKDPKSSWAFVVEDQIHNLDFSPKKKKKSTISGRNIKHLYTIGSMYAQGNVDVEASIGTELPLRIHVDELIKLMKGRKFKMVPKRAYAYLEVV